MIRAANEDDVDELMDLIESMHIESAYSLIRFEASTIKESLAPIINGGHVLVFEANTKIVGFIIGAVYRPWYTPNHTVAAEELLYVVPNYRSAGVGKALLCAFIDFAIQSNANEVKINSATGVMSEAFGKMAMAIGFSQFGTEYRRLL